MPALSKTQQRLMGMAYAYKKGELDAKDASQEVKDLSNSMTLADLKKFAATKHDGLPETVPENIQTGQINGMGPIELPADGLLGSGDVPAGKGDAKKEYKKKKKKMSDFKKFIGGLNQSSVDEARFYAIFKNTKHEIEANGLWAAKQKAITDLKIKKKDVGLLAIVNADEHDDFSKGKNGQFQFETVTIDEVRTSSLGKLEYTEDDVEQTYGWCGTLSDEVGNEKAMDLTHSAIKGLTDFFKWKDQWTALALVNSKAGRHAADAFLKGETDPDVVSAFIWYYGSKSKVNKHAKEEKELQFPGV